MEKEIFIAFVVGLLLYALSVFTKPDAPDSRRKQTPKKTPKQGEQWEFVSDEEGPWPSKIYQPVLILDVRDGWVRYDMSTFKDQRMKLDSFLRMYRPVEGGKE